MTYDQLFACDSGTPVKFKDGTIGALLRWYAGTGTAGVAVASRTQLVEIEPDLFELVDGVLTEQ